MTDTLKLTQAQLDDLKKISRLPGSADAKSEIKLALVEAVAAGKNYDIDQIIRNVQLDQRRDLNWDGTL
jgi:hypothetical protein